jgi:hypothetical protein
LRVGYPVADFCFLVALPPALDLLLFAKHLFVEARLELVEEALIMRAGR